MSIRQVEKEQPAQKYMQTVEMTCDLRGKTIKHPFLDENNWSDCSYDVAKVTISLEEGSSYPEGTDIVETKFDMCPECFKEKLIPAMKAEPRKIRHDY